MGIYSVFAQFDTDNSGNIEYPEFQLLLCKILDVKNPADVPGDRMSMFWKQVDTTSNGEVDFSEFLVWYRSNFFTGNDGEQASNRSNKGHNILKYFYASLATKRVLPVLATTAARYEKKEKERQAYEKQLEEQAEMEQRMHAARRESNVTDGDGRRPSMFGKRKSSNLSAGSEAMGEMTHMVTGQTEAFRPGQRDSLLETRGSIAADEGLKTVLDQPEEDALAEGYGSSLWSYGSSEGEESEGVSEESRNTTKESTADVGAGVRGTF